MRAWSSTCALLAATALLSGPGHSSELSLTALLQEYDNPKASAAQRLMITSNLASLERGFSWANSALRAQRKSRRALYCVPENLDIQPQELIDMLRDALKDEPRLGDSPIGFAVLATLQRAFPCK
jgi:hypothetical protein